MDSHLSLGRGLEESIDIDGPCRIKVYNITHNYVRLLIMAPQSTNILRTELLPKEVRSKTVTELYCTTSPVPDFVLPDTPPDM